MITYTRRRVSSRQRRTGKGPAGLTPAELGVAHLVAQGFTNTETADRLFLSPRTVQAHLQAIYRKLGIHSRRKLRDFAGACSSLIRTRRGRPPGVGESYGRDDRPGGQGLRRELPSPPPLTAPDKGQRVDARDAKRWVRQWWDDERRRQLDRYGDLPLDFADARVCRARVWLGAHARPSRLRRRGSRARAPGAAVTLAERGRRHPPPACGQPRPRGRVLA